MIYITYKTKTGKGKGKRNYEGVDEQTPNSPSVDQ
jgi:hypothetical protein